MATAVWTAFAVATMVGIFAGCVIAVVIGIRLFESLRGKRQRRDAA